MKKMSVLPKLMVVAVSLVLTAPLALQAAESRPDSRVMEKPFVVDTSTDTVIGTVADINYDTRVITLRDSNGETFTIAASPEIARLKEIRKKDVIKVDFMKSVAIFVQPGDKEVASLEGSQSVIVRNKTRKPSGQWTGTSVVTATVFTINQAKRTAVLRSAEGEEFMVDIAPDVKNLENVKKGDQVVVRITRTIGLAVSKP